MKYIVKNCPAIYEYGKGLCCNDLKFDEHTLCEDITDCVIKQIVESCKNVNCDILINTRINNKTRKNRCGAMDGMPLCCEVIAKKDILNLLEIEEVDEQFSKNKSNEY